MTVACAVNETILPGSNLLALSRNEHRSAKFYSIFKLLNCVKI